MGHLAGGVFADWTRWVSQADLGQAHRQDRSRGSRLLEGTLRPVHILRRDWATLGPKVRGKLHIYVGDMDNYYLNDAVYLVEDLLKSRPTLLRTPKWTTATGPSIAGTAINQQPNAISRLRYAQMFIPRIMDQIRKNHPAGVDTLSWRY